MIIKGGGGYCCIVVLIVIIKGGGGGGEGYASGDGRKGFLCLFLP